MTAAIGTTKAWVYYEQRVVTNGDGSMKGMHHIKHKGPGTEKIPISYETYQSICNRVHNIEMNGTVDAQSNVFSSTTQIVRRDSNEIIETVALFQETLKIHTYACVIL